MRDGVNILMAATRQAGELIGLDGFHQGTVYGAFFERAGASMAMQAFSIVIGNVKLQWRRRMAHILHVNVPQSANFCSNASIHYVIGMAGVASLSAWDPCALEMRGRHIHRIVDVEAPTVGCHDVAGETELGPLGSFHMFFRSHGR